MIDESFTIDKETLCEMQDSKTQRCFICNMRKSEA